MLRLFLTYLTFHQDGVHLRTIFGRTLGLRASISSRLLSCGCHAGIYKTWSGRVVAVIDGRDDGCKQDSHRVNRIVWTRAHDRAAIDVVDPARDSKTA